MIETILAATLHASAGGVAPGTIATPIAEIPAIGMATHDGPRRLSGHLYVNAGTGETVFTPAKEYLANRASRAFRAMGDDLNGDGSPDLWINTNTDPCPIGTPTTPSIELGTLDGVTTQGDHHLFKSQIADGGSDLLVKHLSFTFWTDLADTDTDSDTVPDGNTAGLGLEITFWDSEDFFGKSEDSYCPSPGSPQLTRTHITTLEITDLPGPLTAPAPGYLSGFVITLALEPGQMFEIADSDGIGPASGFFNSMVAANDIDTNLDTIPDQSSADTDSNGTIDWSYSFRGIQPNDGRVATIAYTLAAPGKPGIPGVIDGTTGDPISGPVGADDGVIDYGNRPNPPNEVDHTRILISSIIPPMGRSGLPFTSGLLPVPSMLSRFSIFFASLGEMPDPNGPPPPTLFGCSGFSNSDFFGWGAVYPPDGTYYYGLNCEIDDDGDTVPDGRPWSAPFLALSGGGTVVKCSFADCNCDHTLNIDDVECFVDAYLGDNLHSADCDGNGALNIDDIDCFVAAFIGGCP